MRSIFLMLILCAAVVLSCENKVNSSAPEAFNKEPRLLTTLPSGYEFVDAVFSDAGFQVASVLQKDGKVFMSINSVLSPMYDNVRSPVFHDGSGQYAFVARKGDKECVVLNGREGEFYDRIERPLITSEARLVYAAKRHDKWFIISGDKVSQAFDSPRPELYASPDGRRLAFIEQNSAAKKLNLRACSSKLKDCSRGREYDEISDVFSNPSGSHLAYRVVKDGKQAVVRFDFRQPGAVEHEGRWYELVGNFQLSNNGEHAAFFGRRMDKHYLVTARDEWPCADYNMLFDISVSDKGSVLYTGVITDSIILSLDGKVVADRRESIDNLTFSSDSELFLFVAGPCPLTPSDKPVEFAYLVIDGHEAKKYDKIVGPLFSPDNARVVFRARTEGRRFVVVANTAGQILREHSPYDAIWGFKFSPDGKYVGYGVRSGQELWWKAEKL